ncbi:glyoxalase [Verminephrobacter aporrectodeae subsp. tuberculatae]|uniref:Glyoxalase n=1 Tax=Verminephrobacter aporrectodeae subsp. tuberculatae TaxID=1110392 RepID=A0ABT3KPI5_9BURK|nr:VOC family protein [Verminephrobacter aporrectodeae]MCW5319715.1 glyoxalase [Verminephrobacter aporrectodeae subsp. tuberculatae]
MMSNLFTDDLDATRRLFEELLGFQVEFEADWFVRMKAPAGGQLGVMARTSEFIPKGHQKLPQGVMITVVVDDVESLFAVAKEMQLNILEPPRDLPYGQRRMLLLDASGALVDVSSPTAPVDSRYTS